ncbi:hypothetical protein MMC31_002798 [Peltigera leucophlebia]|nr:hypothetical protein [Peltigera leucophlebia]
MLTREFYEDVLGRKPRFTPYVRLADFERWQHKRKTDSRVAQDVASLIALAQKHEEVLKASRFAEGDLATRSEEGFYETLEDLTLPLPHDLIIEKSIPIDMTKDESVPQFLATMADRRLHHALASLASKVSTVANELLLPQLEQRCFKTL